MSYICKKSVFTFSICGPGGGIITQLLLTLQPAGSCVQLLQHGGAQLQKALSIQL